MAESIPMEDALRSITSSFVFAKEQLEALQESPEPPPDVAPSAVPPPKRRFEIADVEIELNYVVAEAEERPPVVVETETSEKVPFTARQITSLKRGAGNTASTFERMLSDYEQAKTELQRLAELGQIPADERVKRTPRVMLNPEDVALLRKGAAQDAVRRFEQLIEDYRRAKNELARLSQLVQPARPQIGLNVRLDAEALAEAAPETRQKVTFRLAVRTTETVLVDGEPVESKI